MSDKPAVSIIMPVYNAGEYLHSAVQSIFAQTFTDWEFIIVDDASTDGSLDYLCRIDDLRVRIIRNERNMKHPASLNRAIDAACGKWYARMDADDVIFPTRLEKQVAYLEANPKIDVVGCGTYLVDKDMKPISVRRPPTTHAEITRWPSLYYPMTYGSLVGKAKWWNRWRVDPRALYPTSYDLYFRSHRESVFANIPDPLYIYRSIGHTRKLSNMNRAVYYRCMTLLRNGFRMGIPFTTLLGLITMLPRPLLYAYKFAVGSHSAIAPVKGVELSEDDLCSYEGCLAKVAETEVPLKNDNK